MALNRQLAFNDAVLGLFKQKSRSVEENSCMYRGENGNKCAIGFLIPDERYDPELEYRTAVNPEVRSALGDEYGRVVTDDDKMFLAQMQMQIHDTLPCRMPDTDWTDEAFLLACRNFANTYNLEMPDVA